MNIGIITINDYNNYGNRLQNYAVQLALKNLKNNAVTIKNDGYSNTKTLYLLRVLKMLLIHDLVEIYSGDTFAFGECNKVQIKESEKKSANKIFGLLPYDQHLEMISLWREFEEQKSSDSIFANTIDRFQPFIIECSLREKEKTIRNINKNQMCERMSIAREGMPELWEVIEKMILENF